MKLFFTHLATTQGSQSSPLQLEGGAVRQAHGETPRRLTRARRTRPTTDPSPRRRSGGFTLMEVNIALLIMAVGLVGLLSLFPVGLRQGDAATSDTTEAAFADLVLNGMRANAQMISTNWPAWAGLTNGVELGVANGAAPTLGGSKVFASGTTQIIGDGTTQQINDYLVPGHYIQYSLHLAPNANNSLIMNAWIQVTNRRYTDITRAPVYATSFVFMGM